MSLKRKTWLRLAAGLTAAMMLPLMFTQAEEMGQPAENNEPVIIENAEPAAPAPTEEPTPIPTEVPTAVPTEAPTAEPTEVPTAVPTAEPTPAPTSVPTEVPTAVPTEVPTPVPTPLPTAEPTQVPTEVPTQEPAATDAPVQEATAAPTEIPTETPAPIVTSAPEFTAPPAATEEVAADLQAWTVQADGTVYTGTIDAVIAHAQKNKPIYITAMARLYVRAFDLTLLQEESANIYFLPDPDVFHGKKWQVVLSLTEDMQTLLTQSRVNAAKEDDDPVQLWIRVVRIEDPTAAPDPTAEPTPEVTVPAAAEETPVPTEEPAGDPTPEATVPDSLTGTTPAPTEADPDATVPATIEETPSVPVATTPEPLPEAPVPVTEAPTSEEQPIQTTDIPAPAVTAPPVHIPEADPTRIPLPDEPAAPAATDTPDMPQIQEKPAIPDPTRIPLPTDQPLDGIQVTATNVNPGIWANQIPSFSLSGVTDTTYYAFLYDDEVITPLESNTYSAEKEGAYILRFALMNKETDGLVDVSSRYTLMLDYTAPDIYVYNSSDKAYTIVISAYDYISGLDTYSVDKGKTWKHFKEGDTSVQISYKETTKLSAGTIQVRDQAGNITVYDKRITAGPLPSRPSYGRRPFKHIKETGEIEGVYAAYDLVLPREEVTQLTLGEETADLSAQDAHGGLIPITEELAALQLPDGRNITALLLRPLSGELSSWVFNGAVLTKLKNTGIDWLALQGSDAILVCPTTDLLTGVTYDSLKAQGIGSRFFTYTIAQENGTFSVLVTVNGETYTATPGVTPGFTANDTWQVTDTAIVQASANEPANS